jgi:3-deoxy-manno-octulosonate cytidylyltransferase (CMP-KDO synthetase)
MHGAVVIIPARYGSTRFPGKPLSLLKGKPLIQHVCEGVKDAELIDTIYVATDDMRVYEVVSSLGYNVVLTSDDHHSGTDRVAEVARGLKYEIVVNVQGDEPFVRPEMVDDVVHMLLDDERASMATLAKRIVNMEELSSPDVVKVVFDAQGYAMYFSRSPIPHHRDLLRTAGQQDGRTTVASELCMFKHIGIYGYRRDSLLRLACLSPPEIERIEGLEQLRALFYGMRIKVKETVHDTIGIDTPDDLRRAEEWLSLSS